MNEIQISGRPDYPDEEDVTLYPITDYGDDSMLLIDLDVLN